MKKIFAELIVISMLLLFMHACTGSATPYQDCRGCALEPHNSGR